MIYTVTANPSVNYAANVPNFFSGGTFKPDEDGMTVGGRGINISRVLKILNFDSTAIGFAGGGTGAYIKNELENCGIMTDFVEINEDTRINIKILGNRGETSIHGAGPQITQTHCDKLLQKLSKCRRGDCIVLTGSVTEDTVAALYVEIARLCAERDIFFAATCNGKMLSKLLPFRPFFIKPTYEELGEVFDTVIMTKEAVYTYGRKLLEAGAQNVVVSIAGKEGAVLITDDKIYTSELPEGTVINTTGAGDAMVAGFIGSCVYERDILNAFKICVAAGSATAFSPVLPGYEDFKRVYGQVRIAPLQQD